MKDFLISLKEISDETEVNVEIEMEQMRKKRLEDLSIRKIPGMLKPSDIDDSD